MTKMYAGAASLAAALLLGVAAHAVQAAGPGTPSGPSAESLVTKVQGIREGGGGGAGAAGGGGASSGGGGGAARSSGGGMTSGGGSGGGGGNIQRGGGGERGSVNRSGGGERGLVNRDRGGDSGSARRGGGDRDRVIGSGRGRWEGRGDHRGRHRYSRHRGGVGIYVGPGYDYYYGAYDDSCEWLRRRAVRSGSSYWWRRFRECIY